MSLFIVWPERREVSAEQIETWFSDAVADGQIAPNYLKADTIERMAEALDDAGYITLGRKELSDE